MKKMYKIFAVCALAIILPVTALAANNLWHWNFSVRAASTKEYSLKTDNAYQRAVITWTNLIGDTQPTGQARMVVTLRKKNGLFYSNARNPIDISNIVIGASVTANFGDVGSGDFKYKMQAYEFSQEGNVAVYDTTTNNG